MRNSLLTWSFRVGGILLALFGSMNILAAMLSAADGPAWSSAILFIGGMLALVAGVFHVTARVVG